MVKNPTRGLSTLELLLAFAILTLTLTAVISLAFGNLSVTVDTQLSDEALARAQREIVKERALASSDFSSASSTTSTETSDNLTYNLAMNVEDISPCKKIATSTVSWNQGLRTLATSIVTVLTDPLGAVALGGDCPTDKSGKRWDNPQRFASDTLNPGKSTALDVLSRVAYLGSDMKPYLATADTSSAYLGQTSGLFVSFSNNFNQDGKTINQINDIDTARINGRVYAFAALASTTKQLAVIDVTDMHNPSLVATRSLVGVTGNTSTSWGWRVYYYDQRLYITTRETSGPEFHIFNVSTPTSPTEFGSGTELNTTANDFTVRDGVAYFADDSDARGELLVYSVADPSNVHEYTGARTDLSGSKNGMSLYVIGNKLYFGRESNSGAELYILDASNVKTTTSGLAVIGTPQEIGGDVLSIRVVGPLCFLVSSKTNQEFQVWDVSNPSAITLRARYNFGNIVAGGIDYEPDFIYATGNSTPNFQILYSPT